MAYDVALDGEDTGVKNNDGKILKYGEVVAQRSEIEKKIGLSLAKDSRVTEIASKIKTMSKVKSYDNLGDAQKDKVDGEVDTFGGARAFKEKWGTLGGSVFAVMNEIEKDKKTKDGYSTVAKGVAHPYFTAEAKKPDFDQPMSDLQYKELPSTAQIYLSKKAMNLDVALPYAPSFNYDLLDSKARFSILKDYRFASVAAKGTADILQGSLDENIMNYYRDNAAANIQRLVQDRYEMRSFWGAIFDNAVDKHSSGDNTNLVKRSGDGGVKDQWIEDAVKSGKPIISGLSGHTLRYLNFWKEKKEANKGSGPSLEAARLVMMANLMPPKHHSYDEIMVSSMAVEGLEYKHRSSYQDLDEQKQEDAQGPASDAYFFSDANEETYNNTKSTRGGVSELDTDLNNVLAGRMNRNTQIKAAIGLLEKAKIPKDVIEVLEKETRMQPSSSH